MRPFFGYYGGKWRDAVKHYPVPTEATIVEPFAGSAGFALRYYDRLVHLYDVDPVICGVWDYLIKVSPSEILAIPDVPLDGSVDDLLLPQEARWLVGFWLNRGVASPVLRPSKRMREGISPGSFWGKRVRERIASQVDSIRHWRVRQASYREIDPLSRSTWFIDPPYRVAGRHYRFGSEAIDYKDLGEWCQTLPGQVICCENDGADWLPFSPLADTKTTRSGHRSLEVIWTKDARKVAP